MTDIKQTRLNKHLALVMGISRRAADNLIASGKVSVNNRIATLGARFFDGDEIKVNNQLIKPTIDYQYILLNKPVGYVCSRKNQDKKPTIYNLLPKTYRHLKPVGRLDSDSSGLILLSNNGDFAYNMTHPKFFKTKIYEIVLDKTLQPLHQQMISDIGLQLKDGLSKLILEKNGDSRKRWTVTMHEGRNRQIRRTFGALGYSVLKLNRTNFGNYSLGDIKPGEYLTVDIR